MIAYVKNLYLRHNYILTYNYYFKLNTAIFSLFQSEIDILNCEIQPKLKLQNNASNIDINGSLLQNNLSVLAQ
jgi:hypothetical protein